MNPTVSVVLPAYNPGTVLTQALASILLQTFRDWELILIDDGSTDGSLAGFKCSDSRVRLIQDGRNLGLAARLNQGIAVARGTFLARMDQDDIAYPERFEVQLRFLEAHPDVDLVGARTLLFQDDGRGIGVSPFRGTHREICSAPWRGFFLPHPTWMGKLEWFRRHRYRLPELVRAEDQELLLRTYATSRFACVPEVLLGYRKTGLPLGKILTARKNLAFAQWSVNLRQHRPGQAVVGLCACLAKAMADLAISTVGAEHLFVSRMTREAPQADIERWNRVWREFSALGDIAPSAYAAQIAP